MAYKVSSTASASQTGAITLVADVMTATNYSVQFVHNVNIIEAQAPTAVKIKKKGMFI